jgi:low affinity Fe/Cu permease
MDFRAQGVAMLMGREIAVVVAVVAVIAFAVAAWLFI